jgi:hypothetical protein
MRLLPSAALRFSLLAFVVGAALAAPRAVEDQVFAPPSTGSVQAAVVPDAGTLSGYRPMAAPEGAGLDDAPSCTFSVAHAVDLPADQRVTLADLVTDRACPTRLNTTVGLTFEVDVKKARENLWWRRAESSFDVLYPTSGSLAAPGRNRVSLSNLVLDEAVTIEVLEADRRLMSFTLKHF